MINDHKRWKWKSDNMLRHKQRQNQEEVWSILTILNYCVWTDTHCNNIVYST